MLTAYWSAKGGSGATVLCAADAIRRSQRRAVVAVDLAGDLPHALGVDEPDAGVADWLRAGDAVPADALDRIAVPVSASLRLIARGRGPLDGARGEVLAHLLGAAPADVVADCGTAPDVGGAAAAVARSADHGILVVRPCYLGLRLATASALAPTGVAVVREPGRALDDGDIAHALGAPVRLSVRLDPNVARSVDAGLLGARMPRSLHRPLDRLAALLAGHPTGGPGGVAHREPAA